MIYQEPIITDQILALGDTHDLSIISRILDRHDLKDCVLIHVGDAGEGFGKNPVERDSPILFNLVNQNLELRNVKLLIIRGNHSNPSYFDPNHFFNKNLSNVEFVQDYSYKTINNKKFLFAGGAVSIDRQLRVDGVDYWKNEIFVLPDNLESLDHCDVLITHSCPTEAPPYGFDNIKGWFKNDLTLKEELIKERQDISKLVKQVQPSQVYYGHFHTVISERIDGIYYRGLDINEVISIINYLR